MQGFGQVIQQVKQPRIEVLNIPGAVIAQEMVQLVERVGQIRVAAAINDLQPLVGVGVIKAQAVFAGRLEGGLRGASRQRGEQPHQEQTPKDRLNFNWKPRLIGDHIRFG